MPDFGSILGFIVSLIIALTLLAILVAVCGTAIFFVVDTSRQTIKELKALSQRK